MNKKDKLIADILDQHPRIFNYLFKIEENHLQLNAEVSHLLKNKSFSSGEVVLIELVLDLYQSKGTVFQMLECLDKSLSKKIISDLEQYLND